MSTRRIGAGRRPFSGRCTTKARFACSSRAERRSRSSRSKGTPVYQASVLGNGYPVLRLLLENGGDPNVATLNGLTPLNAAALRGDVDAMRLLIDKGASVDARNRAGATALMGAAPNGSGSCGPVAAREGADARARGRSSVRPRLATRPAQEAPKP